MRYSFDIRFRPIIKGESNIYSEYWSNLLVYENWSKLNTLKLIDIIVDLTFSVC
ncbi:protein of unknown function [Candidatus Nitrosocosmicus franklandus]|uniref:Uncharacterized protein n=1 Tax=Candidatus Nitrosocosmicus franklandianus TaxID=1798806 RepID=A0A484I6S8_9ARCH|nr:protein of unknown function [Candidatus Nitrosocosmicus franklandus]